LIPIRGIVRSASTGKPLAGALVGLLPVGAKVNAASLLSWGSSNPEGEFKLNNPLPAGRYTIRAKATGFKIYTAEVDVTGETATLTVEM
jgi:hypothetical protein